MVSSTSRGAAAAKGEPSPEGEHAAGPAAANDLRLIIPIQQQQHPQQQPSSSSALPPAAAANEVLHATPPSSPLPREGGRDFVLIGGVGSGRHSGGAQQSQQQRQGQGQQGEGRGHGGETPINSELIDKVDFMGPADSMKALFKMPYTREPVSIAFHRMGETLIVDGALHELYEGPPPPAHGPAASGGASQPQQPPLAHGIDNSTSTSSPPRGGVSSNNKSAQQQQLALAPASFRLPPGPLYLPPPPSDHPHFLHYRLRELSLLMGSDVQVFRNARHPGGVSALFFDEEQGLELSHCLDGYLENVFAAIPELALTMTKRGYIRRCDLVRTEDIPLLQLGPGGPFLPSDARGGGGASAGAGDPSTASTASPADGGTGAEPSEPPSSSSTSSSSRRPLFDPKMLDLNATTLLRFLKENCRAEGSTYLLHREEGGKSVSLYDVTALSAKRQKRWKWLLSMLAYRFAMRIYQQAPLFGRKRRQQLQMRHRRLLQTCLLLLQELSASAAGGGAAAAFSSGGGGQHESLCAAVQEQLADSYLGAAPKSVTHDETTTPSSTSASTTMDAALPFPLPPASAPPVLPAPRQQPTRQDEEQQHQQQPHQPKEMDLNKAEQHLSHGISLLLPLLKVRKEEDEDEGEEDDTPIAFGAFGAGGAAPGGAATAAADAVRAEEEKGGGGGGGGAAALMVMEQMLGLRRKLVGTLRQLIDVHARRRDLPRLLETVRRAMHQVSEAAALAGLHHDQRPSKPHGRRRRGQQQDESGRGPSEEEREVQARVRQWAAEAARDLWSVGAELARGLALRPQEWAASAATAATDTAKTEGEVEEEADTSTTTEVAAASLQVQGIELLAEMDDVLRRILGAHTPTASSSSSPPAADPGRRGSRKKQQHHAAAAMQAAEEVRRALAHAPLRGLALVYLQPPPSDARGKGEPKTKAAASAFSASASSFLVPGDPVQGLLLLDGAGAGGQGQGREARLLLVAAALAQARAVGEEGEGCGGPQQQLDGRLQGLRRLADACNEAGGSLRATLVALSGKDGSTEEAGEAVVAGGAAAASSSDPMPTPALLPRARALGTRAAWGWFHAALALFEACSRVSSSSSSSPSSSAAAADRVNIALVRLNLACVAKVGAACAPAASAAAEGGDGDGDDDKDAWGKEAWIREGLEQGRRAHEALGEREADPRVWRLVTEEVAMLHLMLGLARRRQGGGGTAAVEEVGVVGPLETALALYTQLVADDAGAGTGGGGGGSSNARMAGQVAAVHFNLGSFHAQTWMGSRDRRQARAKLGAALTHYNHAFAHYYRECAAAAAAPALGPGGSAPAAAGTLLRIILDLSQLYLSVDAAAGAAGGGDATCLAQALGCLLKAGPALRLVGEGKGAGTEVEERLGRTLLRLAKVAPGPEAQERAKGMYRRLLLGRKEGGTMAGLVEELKGVYDVGSKK